MNQVPEFSIVVPVYNEAGAVGALADEIAEALDGRAYEMIFVDDGSSDHTQAVLAELKSRHPALRAISHRRNAGQSRAIRTGVLHARAPVIGTLDGDGQNDPADLPALYRELTRPDAPGDLALVMGERRRRQDSIWRRLSSSLANAVRQFLLKDGARDSGCGAKAFRREVFVELPYFDHMHRYMPALVRAEGYSVAFMPVNHRPRASGVSKYTNAGRLMNALADLRGVAWLARRRRGFGGSEEI
ncbi:MAG: glycosyltransferase family 2 protein [Pseudomonadota bacterium]